MTLSFDLYMQQMFESAVRLAANGGHSDTIEILIAAGALPEVIRLSSYQCVMLNTVTIPIEGKCCYLENGRGSQSTWYI